MPIALICRVERARHGRKPCTMLADAVRTSAHQLRPAAAIARWPKPLGCSPARAHKRLIWERAAMALRLRAQLLEYFPNPFTPLVLYCASMTLR